MIRRRRTITVAMVAAGLAMFGGAATANAQTPDEQFVSAMTQKTPVQPGSSGIGTPTLAVNGEVIANSTIPAEGQFATLFQ